MKLTPSEAEELALNFLMAEWDITSDDKEWFSVINTRLLTESWYIVEIGVEGLPDKWFIQVYDTEECDPNYTFKSPMTAGHDSTELTEMPESIAHMLVTERSTVPI